MNTPVNLANTAALDSFELDIEYKGEKTGWIWTLAGPGHPKTVELADRRTQQSLDEEMRRQRTAMKGNKWQPSIRTAAEFREETVDNLTARTLGFTPVDFGNGPIEYSPEAVKKILLDPHYIWVRDQVLNALGETENFLRDLSKTSAPSPNTSSS